MNAIPTPLTPEELSLPLWAVEISTLESPFPFVMKVYAFSKATAFGKVEFRARMAKLTPARRLSAEMEAA